MGGAVMEKKPLFNDDQLISASDAAKKFGVMSDRAQNIPLYVTGNQGKPKTVILGYELYVKFYARLAELEEAENDRILQERLAEIKQNPMGNSVSWKSVRKTNG